jgi:hypothetical protein
MGRVTVVIVINLVATGLMLMFGFFLFYTRLQDKVDFDPVYTFRWFWFVMILVDPQQCFKPRLNFAMIPKLMHDKQNFKQHKN